MPTNPALTARADKRTAAAGTAARRGARSLAAAALALATASAVGFTGAASAVGATASCTAAYEATNGDLSTYTTSTGATADLGVVMAGGTHPGIAQLADGSFEEAVESNADTLWTVSSSGGGVNTGLAMAPGTSPAITPLAGGGFEVAYESSADMLMLYGTAGNLNPDLGMMPETNPAITAGVSGGFEAAFQDQNSVLWFYTSTAGGIDTGQGMQPDTSPALATWSGTEIESAFQSNNGDLTLYGYPANRATTYAMEDSTNAFPALSTDLQVAYTGTFNAKYPLMMYGGTTATDTGDWVEPASSPAIAMNSSGYEVAYENSDQELAFYGAPVNAATAVDIRGRSAVALTCGAALN